MAGEHLAALRGPAALPLWAVLALEGRRLVNEARGPTCPEARAVVCPEVPECPACPSVTCPEAPDFDDACEAAVGLPYLEGLLKGGLVGLLAGAALVLAGGRCLHRHGRAAPRRRGGGVVA